MSEADVVEIIRLLKTITFACTFMAILALANTVRVWLTRE
jgi:hypothetical protein